jgi:hypothetical protein
METNMLTSGGITRFHGNLVLTRHYDHGDVNYAPTFWPEGTGLLSSCKRK